MTVAVSILVLRKALENRVKKLIKKCLKGIVMKKNMNKANKIKNNVFEIPEQRPWDDGFAAFKRRINEQLQLGDAGWLADDDDLRPFYRMGESETYVLSALGFAVP